MQETLRSHWNIIRNNAGERLRSSCCDLAIYAESPQGQGQEQGQGKWCEIYRAIGDADGQKQEQGQGQGCETYRTTADPDADADDAHAESFEEFRRVDQCRAPTDVE